MTQRVTEIRHDLIGNPLRLGILGFGKVARTRFLPALRAVPEVRLAAVASRQPTDAVWAHLQSQEFVVTCGEMVERGRELLDAVYIALPNDMHVPWIHRCARAGLHVLCEKPLAPRLEDANSCAQACQEAGVHLVEAFMYRHDPRHARVRDLIAQGTIGDGCIVEATFSYLLEDLSNIRLSPDRLGGALRDVGCYGIDVARFLFQEEPFSAVARAVAGQHSGVDELVAAILSFSSGRLAVITASTHLAREHRYTVRGSMGWIEVPSAFVPAATESTELRLHSGASTVTERFPPCSAFEAQLRYFAQLVSGEGGRDGLVENGVQNARVLGMLRAGANSSEVADLFRGPN